MDQHCVALIMETEDPERLAVGASLIYVAAATGSAVNVLLTGGALRRWCAEAANGHGAQSTTAGGTTEPETFYGLLKSARKFSKVHVYGCTPAAAKGDEPRDLMAELDGVMSLSAFYCDRNGETDWLVF